MNRLPRQAEVKAKGKGNFSRAIGWGRGKGARRDKKLAGPAKNRN